MSALPAAPVRLLLADVDGTLVTPEKALTERAVAAVRKLRAAGVLFAITSGRPPRGMTMLIDPLELELPLAAFNGGLLVDPHLVVLEQHEIAQRSVLPVVDLLESHGLDAWLYRGAEWYVRQLAAPHVDREARTVAFAPTVVESYGELTDGVAKLVGVSDDPHAIAAATSAAQERFGNHLSIASSQPYYLDVTHPQANKGAVVLDLSTRYSIPRAEIATIGDGPNDTLMFAKSGLSIAMGNAGSDVKHAATVVTSSNTEEGFANAVERFILPRAPG
ncbi:MAG TPA: Cof-type HAD-IIB family hydrolase [Solirubrobacteraceae bacterium]|nr:Cof-type HAD-IIB family hydrolase [Solirubrobacteraceae bacterium]